MMCYKDMTFCTFYQDCAHASTCHRPLTPDVRAAAMEWTNTFTKLAYALVMQYTEQPECHSSKDIDDDEHTKPNR